MENNIYTKEILQATLKGFNEETDKIEGYIKRLNESINSEKQKLICLSEKKNDVMTVLEIIK